ncbi:hypothetical protein GO755_19785 [Spirosoma sp. HMF4905]|uniref:Peptidase S74 domain-containing protein n=1 Tax=Spirosoma arboris TaxID=2682092 RepID=A0A7K1SF15_9BACT|nr:tail fiber domain-containing protein [Spirosoma arboris]MVM32298.1 hypothetical protein [Spirosoma arboris]
MKNVIGYVRKIALSVCLFVTIINVHAQVGIGPGSETINGSASVEIKAGSYSSGSPYRGLLPPIITTTQRGQIQNPATGLLIFNTSTNQIEVNTGTSAAPIWTPGGAVGSGAAWSLTGNAGTVNTNFLGTTDNTPLRFRVNNQNAGRIDPTLLNLGLGYQALNPSATGQANTALGYASLFAVTSGVGNTASGSNALAANTSGSLNSALGNVALQKNTTGEANTAVGSNALQNNTGSYNTAFGAGALQNNTTPNGNTALGHNALANNTSGTVNTAVGEDALSSNSTGHDNTAVGINTLGANTTGNGNVTLGNVTLTNNTTGENNTAIGLLALLNNTTGNYNTALGANAGPSAANPTLVNATALGANAIVNTSHTIVLGDNQITSLRCNVQTISSLSDKRIKEDVSANVPGLSFITRLTPVTYHINKAKEAKLVGYSLNAVKEDKILHSGFLAQDVETAAQAVGYNFEGVRKEEGGKYYTIGYTLFVIPLVQAVKELNDEVSQLKAELAIAKQNEKDTQVRLDKIEALLQLPTRQTSVSLKAK